MNKIVAVTALAAAPVASPSIAATAAPTIAPAMPQEDRRSATASLRRAEEVVELLRTRYIRKGWKIDEEAAERALAYCRKYAANGPVDDDQDAIEFRQAADFFYDHGISIDWVFDGDIAGLICRCAQGSRRADNIADAELIALCDQFLEAGAEWSRLNRISDEMDGYRCVPCPEALKVDQGDASLGIPSPLEGAIYGGGEVNKMRGEKWLACTKTGTDDDMTLRMWRFQPSAEARARADEIIAAYVKWDSQRKRKPKGFRAAMRATKEAMRHYSELEVRILDTRATSPAGMIAKARCYDAISVGDFAESIVDDLLAIAPQA